MTTFDHVLKDQGVVVIIMAGIAVQAPDMYAHAYMADVVQKNQKQQRQTSRG